MTPDNSPAAKARRIAKLWDDHLPSFEQEWMAMAKARDFVFKAAHYPAATRIDLERRNRVAPITNDTWDVVRFKADQIANSEIYLDVQPEVPGDLVADPPQFDPGLGDFVAPKVKPKADPRIAKWALEQDVFDPLIGYDRVRERMALDGIGSRVGCCLLEWDPAQGTRGRIFPRRKRASDILWHSSYLHPHDPGNPFIIIRDRVSLEDAKALWPKKAAFLRPDSRPANAGLDSTTPPLASEPLEPGKVTIYRIYQLYDWTSKYRLDARQELQPLKRQEEYMGCQDCGWEGPTAGSLRARLPAEEPCPVCGGTAIRIETSGKIVPTAAYRKGKRYTVIAPFCTDAGLLDDGGWPGDPRSYPLMYFVPGVNPDEKTGMSDTEWLSDQQCAIDASMRIGYEQMQRNRDYLFVLMNAFFDAQGEPHQFDGTSDFVAWTESPEALGAIKHFQGSGIPAALPTWMNILVSSIQRTRGIGQLSGSTEDLKGMQVGVAQRFMDSGDVPVNRAVDTFRREETILFQCWHDMQRNLYTRADWIGLLGEDGDRAFQAFRGEDLPQARIKVTAKPMIRAADMEHAKVLRDLLSTPMSDAAFEIVAQQANIPQEWLRRLKDERKQQAAAQAGMAAGAGQAGPGMAPLPQGMNGMAQGIAHPGGGTALAMRQGG